MLFMDIQKWHKLKQFITLPRKIYDNLNRTELEEKNRLESALFLTMSGFKFYKFWLANLVSK
jgi:hypothetical protein